MRTILGILLFLCAISWASPLSDHGPWLNQDESLSFSLLPKRLSWWLGEKECAKRGLVLPTWDELSVNWNYLLGTTPINSLISQQAGCALTCPTSIWTSDEKNKDLAYEFSNYQPHSIDPRGAPKYWKYSVVCVKRE